jgi:hypothetical protein
LALGVGAVALALLPHPRVLQGVTAKVEEDQGGRHPGASEGGIAFEAAERNAVVVLPLRQGVIHKKIDQDHHGDGDTQANPVT